MKIIQLTEDILIVTVEEEDEEGNETVLVFEVFGMYDILLSPWSVSSNPPTVSIFIQKVTRCTYGSLPIDKA